jgi:Type IV secretion-system coupling protein DNA-binding domain
MARNATNVLRFPDAGGAGATFIGTDVESDERVYITRQARGHGTCLIGATGQGKTNLQRGMLDADIRQARGVCLIEPHGDLTRAVVANIPEERLKDTILLDMQDEASFGLNPFECADLTSPTEVATTAAFLMHAFTAIWSVGPETPLLTQTLRHLIRFCIEAQATLDMIPLILWDDAVRARLLTQVRNAQTRAFFEAYGLKNRKDRELQVSSVVNKLDALLAEPLIARILCQKRSTIDFGKAMREGRIVLILLPPALEESANLLGSLLISRILLSVFHRAGVSEGERREFALYCDEYSRFASPDFAVLLAEFRKFGLLTTTGFQYLSQLDPVNQAAVQTAGTLIVFRVSGADARVLAPSFNRQPKPERVGDEPLRAPVSDVVGHLVHKGHHRAEAQAFCADYLLPLVEGLIRTMGGSMHPMELGGVMFRLEHALHGRMLLNDVLSEAQRTGRSDLPIAPLALFMLGAAASQQVPKVFTREFKSVAFSGGFFQGFRDSAYELGKPELLTDQEALTRFLEKHGSGFWDRLSSRHLLSPGEAFVRMLRSLRQVMQILSKEPVLTETGVYVPRMQQRLFSDVQGEIENALVTMPPYHCRVRLVSGEHTIRTHPAPQGLSGRPLQDRMTRIQRQMRFLGYTRPAAEIDEEIRKRQERLRGN